MIPMYLDKQNMLPIHMDHKHAVVFYVILVFSGPSSVPESLVISVS